MASGIARRLELAIVFGLLAACGLLASMEARSGVAEALRTGRPLPALLATRGGERRAPRFYLVYHPVSRALDVLELPPDGLRRLPQLPRPQLELSTPAEADGAPELRRWMEGWPRGPRFIVAAWRAVRALRGAATPYDAALLALEAYRLAAGDVRVALVPGPALRQALADRLLGPEAQAAAPSAIRVEVLNASGEPGVAQEATRVLRGRAVDVIDYGNGGPAQDFTCALDRAGRPQDARRAGELLGCAGVEIRTQLDFQAAAPVAVVLGRDYRRCRALR